MDIWLLVPKLITISAASISFSQYPLISTLLAWGVTLAVCYIIATAPIQLRGGLLLAVACLLVPSDPEVFGLPLYTFWWVSILLFVVVFWNQQSTDWGLRSAIIATGKRPLLQTGRCFGLPIPGYQQSR